MPPGTARSEVCPELALPTSTPHSCSRCPSRQEDGWLPPQDPPQHPGSLASGPWKVVLRLQGIKGQLYFRVGLPGESQGGEEPNPARWCDRSAFGPFIHSTAVSGTPTMHGARASSAGPAPALQPLAGTLATRPGGRWHL